MTAAGLVQFAGLSDIGRLRTTNQDRWGADPGQSLFMVADGVALSKDGAVAAALVVELLPTYVARHLKADDRPDDDRADDDRAADHEAENEQAEPEALGQALIDYCADFRAFADTDPRVAGSNSTLVAVVISGSRALVSHLGDSRAYLLRDAELQRLTRDHSLIQELIDANQVPIEEAETHPARNTVTRHIAMHPRAIPDSAAVDVRPGDRILLSTDGLHGVVDEESLIQILDSHPGPDDACAALIEAANKAGGPDNITAVIIDIALDDQ